MTDNRLRQDLKFRQYFNLSFGTIVGVGWIVVMSTWLLEGGTLGATLAFLIAGIFISAIGICYAKLAVLYPVTGGSIAYAYNVFGAPAAFIIGWLMVLKYVAASAFGVVSTSWVLEALYPPVQGPVLYHILGTDIHLGTTIIGFFLLIFISAVNYYGAKLTAKVQDYLTYIFLVLGLIVIFGGIYNGNIENLLPLFKSPDWKTSLLGFSAILVTTPFFLAGFDVVPQAMGEKHKSVTPRHVMVAVVGSILLAMTFYIAVIIGTAMLLPRGDFANLNLAVAEAFTISLGSETYGRLVLLCGLFGILSSWNALFFAGTRVLFALGRAQFLPKSLAALSPEYQTPKNAIFLIAMTGLLVIFCGKGIILPLVKTHVTVISTVFFTMALAVFKLQKTGAIEFQSKFRGQLVSVSAMAFAAVMIAMAVFQAYLNRQSAIPLEWTTLAIWIVTGICAWHFGKSERLALSEEERSKVLCHGQA